MATRRRDVAPSEKEKGEGAITSEDEEDVPNTAIVATFISVSISTVLMFMYIGYMPALYSAHGIDTMTYGYIQSTFAFLQLCSSPLIGRLADIIGPRQVLLISMVSCSLAHLTLGVASSSSMLIMSRAVSILMDPGPACQMVLMKMVPESARSRYLSRSMLPMGVGLILGPVIGGAMAARLGPQQPLIIGSTVGVVAISIAVAFIPQKSPGQAVAKKKDEKRGLSHYSRLVTKWPTPILLSQRLLSILPLMTFMMNIPIAGATHFKLDPQSNGLLISSFGIMTMLNNAVVIPYITSTYNEDALFKVAPLISVFSFFFLSQSNSVLGLLMAMYPLSVGSGLSENIATVRLTKSVDASDTNTILGLGAITFHLSGTLAPSAGGILLHWYGWPGIGVFGCIISMLCASLAFTL